MLISAFCFQFTFGIDDDGVVIDDVELPKWASSPEEFVMLHRAVRLFIYHWQRVYTVQIYALAVKKFPQVIPKISIYDNFKYGVTAALHSSTGSGNLLKSSGPLK